VRMTQIRISLGLISALLSVGFVNRVHANLSTFTQRSDFDAAISMFVNTRTVDFEGAIVGNEISSGSTFDDITFTYNFGIIINAQIRNDFDTTSGNNSLGSTGDGLFFSGDELALSFAEEIHAFGLFVIAGDDIFASDFTVTVPGGSVSNTPSTDTTFGTLPDGGKVFFLGVVESDLNNGFTSATLSSASGFDFFFNVDDIVYAQAIPEPNTFMLFGTGLLLLIGYASRSSQR